MAHHAAGSAHFPAGGRRRCGPPPRRNMRAPGRRPPPGVVPRRPSGSFRRMFFSVSRLNFAFLRLSFVCIRKNTIQKGDPMDLTELVPSVEQRIVALEVGKDGAAHLFRRTAADVVESFTLPFRPYILLCDPVLLNGYPGHFEPGSSGHQPGRHLLLPYHLPSPPDPRRRCGKAPVPAVKYFRALPVVRPENAGPPKLQFSS